MIMASKPTFLLNKSSVTPLLLPLPFTQFSSPKNMFDPGKELPKSYVSLSDHIGGRLSDSDDDSYGHAMNNDSRMRSPAQNHANCWSWNTLDGMFGGQTSMVEDDESGISTPPLWRTSPSRSPSHQQNVNYRCLSPSSKAQAIARGQRELMEMVSRMPESCYELSLKDLVEHQPVVEEPKQESFAEGRSSINENSKTKENGKDKKKKQTNRKPQINRSGSLDNGGFLLKMVFPVSLGSKKKKKKKKNDSKTNNNSKVSPKPIVADASGKAVDKDWWKKRSGLSESESGGSTINSGSTKSSLSSSGSNSSGGGSSCRSISTTSRRHRRNGCLAFILLGKAKHCGKKGQPLSHS